MRISDWSSDVCSSDLPAQGQHPGAVEPHHLDAIHHDAAGLRPLQPVDAADQGALAGAAAADDAEHLAGAHLQRDVLKGGDGRAAGGGEFLADPGEADDRGGRRGDGKAGPAGRSEEHTSELQSLMRISYAVFCLNKKTKQYKERLINK